VTQTVLIEQSIVVCWELQLLTLTVLSRHEEGRWNATTLESLPDKINVNTLLWIDAQDLSPEEILLLNERFGLTDELNI
jgi:hypothetical protein